MAADSRRPVRIEVGARVRYLGPRLARYQDGDRGALVDSLETGDVGTVISVVPPLESTELWVGRDGYAGVKWPRWRDPRVIWPGREGARWERA